MWVSVCTLALGITMLEAGLPNRGRNEGRPLIRMQLKPWQKRWIYPKGSGKPLKGIIQGRKTNR